MWDQVLMPLPRLYGMNHTMMSVKEGQQHLDTLLEMSIRWMGATMAKTIASDDLSIAKRALHTAEIARHVSWIGF